MEARKYRWSKTYEAAEEDLIALLAAKNAQAERIELEPHDATEEQKHDGLSRIWCAEGSCRIGVQGKSHSLQPGDAIDVPANHTYSINAGLSGCAFYVSR